MLARAPAHAPPLQRRRRAPGIRGRRRRRVPAAVPADWSPGCRLGSSSTPCRPPGAVPARCPPWCRPACEPCDGGTGRPRLESSPRGHRPAGSIPRGEGCSDSGACRPLGGKCSEVVLPPDPIRGAARSISRSSGLLKRPLEGPAKRRGDGLVEADVVAVASRDGAFPGVEARLHEVDGLDPAIARKGGVQRPKKRGGLPVGRSRKAHPYSLACTPASVRPGARHEHRTNEVAATSQRRAARPQQKEDIGRGDSRHDPRLRTVRQPGSRTNSNGKDEASRRERLKPLRRLPLPDWLSATRPTILWRPARYFLFRSAPPQ